MAKERYTFILLLLAVLWSGSVVTAQASSSSSASVDTTSTPASSSTTHVFAAPLTVVTGSSQPTLDVPPTTAGPTTESETSLDTSTVLQTTVRTTGTPRIFAPKTGSRQPELDVPSAPTAVASGSQTGLEQPKHVISSENQNPVPTTPLPATTSIFAQDQSPGQRQDDSPNQSGSQLGSESSVQFPGNGANPAGIIASLLGFIGASGLENNEPYATAALSAQQHNVLSSATLQQASIAGHSTGVLSYGIDGTPVIAGAPATVIDGTTYSLAASGTSLWVNGRPTSVAASSLSTFTDGRLASNEYETLQATKESSGAAALARTKATASEEKSVGGAKSTALHVSSSATPVSTPAVTGGLKATAQPTKNSSGAFALLPNAVLGTLCLVASI